VHRSAKPQEMGVDPLCMWPGGLCDSRWVGILTSFKTPQQQQQQQQLNISSAYVITVLQAVHVSRPHARALCHNSFSYCVRQVPRASLACAAAVC
jgi:hypothetical protein